MRYAICALNNGLYIADGYLVMSGQNDIKRLNILQYDDKGSAKGVPIFNNHQEAEMFTRIIFNSLKPKTKKKVKLYIRKFDTPENPFKINKNKEPFEMNSYYKDLCSKHGINVLLYTLERKH